MRDSIVDSFECSVKPLDPLLGCSQRSMKPLDPLLDCSLAGSTELRLPHGVASAPDLVELRALGTSSAPRQSGACGSKKAAWLAAPMLGFALPPGADAVLDKLLPKPAKPSPAEFSQRRGDGSRPILRRMFRTCS